MPANGWNIVLLGGEGIMIPGNGCVGASRRNVLQKMVSIGGLATAGLIVPGSSDAAPPGALGTPHVEPPQIAAGNFAGIFDVRNFGARGDGRNVDTAAVNRTIEAAAAAGGGTVLFPSGTYLCFSIHLKSKVSLYLAQGATIVAGETGQGGNYDEAEPNPWDMYQDYGHSHWHNALLWGEGLSDIAILGPGLIWGKGLTRGRNERGAGVGDKSLSLKNCRNVLVRDVSFLHAGHFAILATGVDSFTVDNVKIDTNRDGIDFDCCRNVRVSNCTVNSPWDDGLCPKSSYALGYARTTENVTLTNCYVTGNFQEGTLLDGTWKPFPPGARISRTGRFKCGTESNGGFKNITVSNCVFEGCRGLALETVDGALLEDIAISNVTMRDVAQMPIFMRLGARLRGPKGIPIGKLRRVQISGLVASHSDGRYASVLSGIPGHDIEDVKLTDITILHQGGGTKADAALQLEEKENGYPEPDMFGPTPSYGFYIRHVNRIEMSNIEVRYENEDQRPPILLKDVKRADFLHVKADHAPGVPVLAMKDVTDFNLYLSRPLADTHVESAQKKDL
jgi:polygalacturonase